MYTAGSHGLFTRVYRRTLFGRARQYCVIVTASHARAHTHTHIRAHEHPDADFGEKNEKAPDAAAVGFDFFFFACEFSFVRRYSAGRGHSYYRGRTTMIDIERARGEKKGRNGGSPPCAIMTGLFVGLRNDGRRRGDRKRERERERDQRDRLQEPWLSPSWCPRRLVGEENTDTVVGRCVCVRAYSAMVVTSYKTSTNRCKKPTPLRYSRFIGFNGIIYRRSRWTEPITPRTTNENSNVQNTHTRTKKTNNEKITRPKKHENGHPWRIHIVRSATVVLSVITRAHTRARIYLFRHRRMTYVCVCVYTTGRIKSPYRITMRILLLYMAYRVMVMT